MTESRGTDSIADSVWENRFRLPQVFWAQQAHLAPERGLAVSNVSGVFQLCAWDLPTGALRQLTARPEGLMAGVISPDGRHVYYLDDARGDEIGHYVRVPFAGGATQDVTPDLAPYSSLGLTFSRSGNLLGMLVAYPDGFHLYVQDTNPGGMLTAPRRLQSWERLPLAPVLSHRGELAAVGSTERTGNLNATLVALDTMTGELVGELSDGADASVEPVTFSPLSGDPRLLATTDRTGAKRPLLWNPRTNERHDLATGTLEGEIVPVDWSPDGRWLLLCQYSQARQQFFTYDLAEGTLHHLTHPSGSYTFFGGGGVYFAGDGTIHAVWEDATHPPQVIALDMTTGSQLRSLLGVADVPASRPWRSITFPSTAGQVIQGWLAVPEGTGPFPTIIETHGGPTAVQMEAFSPNCQAWLDAGFAYCTINYRGSTTFGSDFEHAIWGDLGHWEVDDVVAARAWLVEQGIARSGAVFLTGWSYGGYLTLQTLGTHPDLWAGGMAGIAIADWRIQYEDIAATLRGYQVALLGGTPQERPEVYAAASPITYADQIQAPVLILQGRNDTRTPRRPVEMYEAKLKALGKPVEVVWFDAGHLGAFAQVEQSITFQRLMLRFTRRVLAGDAGESVAST